MMEFLVMWSFEESNQVCNQVPGKMALWDYFRDWHSESIGCYGKSVMYRSQGVGQVAAADGLASLVRAVGPREVSEEPISWPPGFAEISH